MDAAAEAVAVLRLRADEGLLVVAEKDAFARETVSADEALDEVLFEFDPHAFFIHADDQAVELLTNMAFHEAGLFPGEQIAFGIG